MAAILKDIDQLKLTAKINSGAPFEVFTPFLQEARDVFLVRYLGEDLIEVLELDDVPDRAKKLLDKTRLCLGPLALWLGTGELSVRMGDSGFTVEKRDSPQHGPGFVPASDSKIAHVTDSFQRRAFNYLDIILEYLEENAADFPEWKYSNYYKLKGRNFIDSAKQFQETGIVDINYSRLTFEHFRPAMSMIELRYIEKLLGVSLDNRLRAKISDSIEFTPAENALVTHIRRFVACKTAEIHTSEKSKLNRETSAEREYRPVVRPLFVDPDYTGNWFADQADFYLAEIQNTLNENADEFGIEPLNMALDWNNEERKIFVDIG